jgi:chromosome segregation ATPase
MISIAAGCAKSDCTQARGALERVAEDMQTAAARGETMESSAFAERLAAEVSALEIEHDELRRALDKFVEATRELAEKRHERDQLALSLARAHDRLRALRAELDDAYAALANDCEHGVERCLVLAELDHVVAGLGAGEASASNPAVRQNATKIRAIVAETAQVMQALIASQGDMHRLKTDVEDLERRAARLGLQVGAHCPG